MSNARVHKKIPTLAWAKILLEVKSHKVIQLLRWILVWAIIFIVVALDVNSHYVVSFLRWMHLL